MTRPWTKINAVMQHKSGARVHIGLSVWMDVKGDIHSVPYDVQDLARKIEPDSPRRAAMAVFRILTGEKK